MFRWFWKFLDISRGGDLSEHRRFTVTNKGFRYEDLCQ